MAGKSTHELFAEYRAMAIEHLKQGEDTELHTVVLTRADLRALIEEDTSFAVFYVGQLIEKLAGMFMPGAVLPSPSDRYRRQLQETFDEAIEQAQRCTQCREHPATLCASCHHQALVELATRTRAARPDETGSGNSYGLDQSEMG